MNNAEPGFEEACYKALKTAVLMGFGIIQQATALMAKGAKPPFCPCT